MASPHSPKASAAYSILVPGETMARAAAYLKALRDGEQRPGRFLQDCVGDVALAGMTELELLGRLFDTKPPQIFAESAVAGDGSDWNLAELKLLGDISVAVPVTVFDDGNHRDPTPHAYPFSATLLYTPGALLRNGRRKTPADLEEVTGPGGQLDAEGYYGLYRRRLLPVFQYVNARAGASRSTLVTVPGLGCGQFAGQFQGQLGARLEAALARFLTEDGSGFPNIKAVYFDPFNECTNARREINGISFMVRPLTKGNAGKSQLCPPAHYAETGDDFSKCQLFSIVAWDHVSWPGNDFYAGSRATDDGVKAAATSSMHTLTGVTGRYDVETGTYQPPAPYRDWEQVVLQNKLRLWNPAAVWPSPQGGVPVASDASGR